MRYVIIGNSVAGINAALAIRQNNDKSDILIISDEQTRAYSRPLLPNWIVGEVSFSDDRFFYRRNDFYDKNNLETILGNKVDRVDTNNKLVILDNDTKLFYDKLIIASGASAILPKAISGVNLNHVYTLTNIKGAKKLKDELDTIRSIVIVGAGLIGTKMAYDLSRIGKKVTLVELAKRVLFPAIDDYGALLIQEQLKRSGINIILNDSVVELKGASQVQEVILSSGKNIPCDACLISVGVKANTDFLNDNIKVDKGIVADETMKAQEDIWVAGDVASVYDSVLNINRPIPILPLAAKEGFVAGQNASGERVVFDGGFAMNSIEIGEIGFISMGIIESDEDEILEYKKDNEYRKFIIRDNRLLGVILINNVEKAGMFNWMIEKGFDVSWIKDAFLNGDFGWKYFDKAFRVLRLDRKLKR